MSRQFVIIDLEHQKYCIPIELVNAVIDHVVLTKVPNTLSYVEGVSNIRGEILPVVNLKKVFGIASDSRSDHKLMSISLGSNDVGLLVDSASNVISVDEEHIRVLPPLLLSKERRYFQSAAEIDGELLIIINPRGLFSEEEKEELFSLKDR